MTSRTTLSIGFAVLMLASLAPLSAAHAQYAPPPPYYPPPGYGPPPAAPRGIYRGGLVFGVGIGAGAITANDCTNCGGGAGALELHIGGMINPRLAILAEVWGLARPLDGGATLTFTGVTLDAGLSRFRNEGTYPFKISRLHARMTYDFTPSIGIATEWDRDRYLEALDFGNFEASRYGIYLRWRQ